MNQIENTCEAVDVVTVHDEDISTEVQIEDQSALPSNDQLIDSNIDDVTKPRNVYKPNINHLPDAIGFDDMGNAIHNVRVGDRIVLEYSDVPYRDTVFAKVLEYKNDANGTIWLREEEFSKSAVTSVAAIRSGRHIVKIAGHLTTSTLKSKRGRAASTKITPVNGREKMNHMEDMQNDVMENTNSDTNTESVNNREEASPSAGRRGRPKGAISKDSEAKLVAAGIDISNMTREQKAAAWAELKKPATPATPQTGGKRGRPLGWLADDTKAALRARGIEPDNLTPEQRRDAAKELRASLAKKN